MHDNDRTFSEAATLFVSELQCESRSTPIGIDAPHPRFSWVLNSLWEGDRGQVQTAWQIQVATDRSSLMTNKAVVWDSGKVNDWNSNNVGYQGDQLVPGKTYYWRVKVWDKNNVASDWSEPSFWKMGLLSEKDWDGQWITDSKPRVINDSLLYEDQPAPIFRKLFSIDKKIRRAMLYISGLGYYEAYLNGQRVGNQSLDPGQTDYAKRVFYSTYEVTGLLNRDDNCIGVMLGNGWYNPLPLKMWGSLNIRDFLTIGQPSFKVQLNIQYEDGSKDAIFTNEEWQVTEGPIIRNSVYLGEHIDYRALLPGWSTAQFEGGDWRKVMASDPPKGKLKSQYQPAITVRDTLVPTEIKETGAGKYRVDFGRNFGGNVKMRVKAKRGTVIKVRYGELLYPDGSLNVMTSTVGQIKKAGVGGPGAPEIGQQEDVFITAGTGVETFQPRFTYHGFRYAEVSGYPSVLKKEDIQGLVMSSNVTEVSKFDCSNPLINKIQQNCRNTFLSNLFSIQSDCPHREKFGYGGDILATSEAFMNNFDMNLFYDKTVIDFSDAARDDGGLTETAPFVGISDAGLGNQSGPIEWGTVHPVLLYRLYQYYGNSAILKAQYPVAKKWLEFLKEVAVDNIIDVTLGDHESIDKKDIPVSGTSFYYYNAFLLAKIAQQLNYPDDEERYTTLANEIKESFNSRFVNRETGRVGLGTQATQVHALYFDLLSKPVAQKAFAYLEELIRNKDNGHISTGMFGTKFILEVLSRYGNADLAYQMVTKEGFPGWVHMIDHGATTIWEHWAFSDNTFSHNHPMFGVVSEWFFRYLAGIRPAEDAIAFNKIVIQPQPTGLTFANASYSSALGKISTDWKIVKDQFHLEVIIPVNASATIFIPSKENGVVSESGTSLAVAEGIEVLAVHDNSVQIKVGSGHYKFESSIRPK